MINDGLLQCAGCQGSFWHFLPHTVTLALPDTSFLEGPIDWLEEVPILLYMQDEGAAG